MHPDFLPWIILFLPLCAAVLIPAFHHHDSTTSASLSIAAVVIGFVLSILFIAWVGWMPTNPESAVTWLGIGGFKIEFGLHLDALSLLMMLVVTGVASAIHINSWGYMNEDRAV